MSSPLEIDRPGSIQELRRIAFAGAWQMLVEALELFARGEIRFREQPRDPPRRQWFRMHPELLKIVQARLEDGSFFAIQEQSLREARSSSVR